MTTTQEIKGIKVHDLKCWPDQFFDVAHDHKSSEFRRNDRDFQRGDLLLLREYIPTEEEWQANGGARDEWDMSYWVDWNLKSGIEDDGKDHPDEDYERTINRDLPCYTGNTVLVQVTHVQTGFGIPDGFCVLSIARVKLPE